jgi:hypothetical protein
MNSFGIVTTASPFESGESSAANLPESWVNPKARNGVVVRLTSAHNDCNSCNWHTVADKDLDIEQRMLEGVPEWEMTKVMLSFR